MSDQSSELPAGNDWSQWTLPDFLYALTEDSVDFRHLLNQQDWLQWVDSGTDYTYDPSSDERDPVGDLAYIAWGKEYYGVNWNTAAFDKVNHAMSRVTDIVMAIAA